jgi:hypothetical protein
MPSPKLILSSFSVRRYYRHVPLHFIRLCLQFLGEEDFFKWNLPILLRSFGISFQLCQRLGVGEKHNFITHRVILGLFRSLRLPIQYLKASTKICSMPPSHEMQVIARNYLKEKYILSKDIWIVLQICWISIMMNIDCFTEEYKSLNVLLRDWLRPDNPLIHGIRMILWLKSAFADSAFMTPMNIMQIICKREQYGKPCSFFHDICKGMIHQKNASKGMIHQKNAKAKAKECFETAKRRFIIEDPIHIELYMMYLNEIIAKSDIVKSIPQPICKNYNKKSF